MTTTTNYGFTVPTIGSDKNTWGTEINNDLTSIDSYLYLTAKGNIGSSAPTTPAPTAGMIWINNTSPSATVWNVQMYDGTNWVVMGTLDSINHKYTPYAQVNPTLDGQVIIGATSGSPTAATLTGGTGVSITNGANSITVGLSSPVSSTNGGTGVNNGSSTITLGGNLTTSGANPLTLTTTATTNVTLPTSGTLVNSSVTTLSSLASVGTIGTGTWQGTVVSPTYGGTGLSNPTSHGILVGQGSSAISPKVLTNGQLLIGSTGVDPVAASLTAGSNITITPGAGTITIAASTSGSSLSVVAQTFTASGTYTPTTNMKYCIIEVWAGGGAGGAATAPTTSACGGGSGGAGSYSRTISSAATVGASQTVTIGAAGVGGTGAGGSGGNSSVGTLCTANGGSGGGFGSGATPGGPGPGGTAGSGTVSAPGQSGVGSMGFTSGIASLYSPTGACSMVGSGGRGSNASSSVVAAGNSASGYAAGGGGGVAFNTSSTGNGGNGSPGLVVITEYIY